MKKLTKLNINPEKVMMNDELITLKGGYDEWLYLCRCGFTPNYAGPCTPYAGITLEQALQQHGNSCNGLGATCNGISWGCPS